MTKSRLRVLLFVLAQLALVNQSWAGSSSRQKQTKPLKELTLEQLGNVEVSTVTKLPEQVWQTPAAVYVLTSQDIQRSGATSVQDALRLVPGVEVARIDSNMWAVGIRGSETNFSKAVLVLIDGRSVYTPLYNGVYWDVQDLVLEDIDRIEVIRGPGAAVWGPNSADGVINIVTKKASETQGGLVSVLGGNVDNVVAEAQYGGTAGTNLSYRAYGRGFIRGPEYHPNGDNYDEWSEERGGFRMDWNRGNGSDVMVESDMYGGTSPQKLSAETIANAVAGGDVVARWERNSADGSGFYLEAYFDRTLRDGILFDDSRSAFDLDLVRRSNIGRTHRLTYGAELHWSPSHFTGKTPILNIFPNTQDDYVHTGFVQDEVHLLNDKLLLTGGLKLQYDNFTGCNVLPTARILWNPNQHQSFWAAVTRAVTTPSSLEEGYSLVGQISVHPPEFLAVLGNPNFQSETVLSYEGGYRQLLSPKIYVDLDVFHNDYDHLQSFSLPALIGNTLTIYYENAIAGSTNGVEIAPTWQPNQWWKLSGSYSYVGIDFHANSPGSDISSTGSVRTYGGSSPAHQVKIQSFINLGHRFEFDQLYAYVSALPAQGVRAYQTMDGRFEWKLPDNFSVAVVGQNLFQPYHYEWGTGDPTQPLIGIRRSGYLQLTWSPAQ